MLRATILLSTLLLATPALAEDEAATEDAAVPAGTVYIISPEDGAVVESPVTVVFGLKGMGVAPAGVEKEGTGHHHLLIDTDAPTGEALEESLPADENHVHFGGGQTETEIELAPGLHTLQLLLADANHVPHDPVIISDKITIRVKDPDPTVGTKVDEMLDKAKGVFK